ncbi:hypothetical protein N875_10410 [Neisseria meningitidis LNP21362]|nr:hypothetical protein N875_10410 [Neisseria meningitidis LNP21362]
MDRRFPAKAEIRKPKATEFIGKTETAPPVIPAQAGNLGLSVRKLIG